MTCKTLFKLAVCRLAPKIIKAIISHQMGLSKEVLIKWQTQIIKGQALKQQYMLKMELLANLQLQLFKKMAKA